MRRRLVLSHVLLVAVVLVVLEVPLGIVFARRQHADLAESATRQAALIATFIGPDFDEPVSHSLDVVLRDLGGDAPAEITVVDRAGTVLASRHGQVPDDLDATPRSAIEGALAGQVTAGELTDDHQRWAYAAVPVASRDSAVGAVVVSVPARAVQRRIRNAWLLLGALAAGILLLAVLVAAAMARWLARPIDSLGHAVAGLSAGNLESVAPTDVGPPELRSLAEQFNDMAGRLRELVDNQRRFIADASHQLRAPLTALRLRIEMLEQEPGESTEAALAEADRLGRLVDGLLALSRAEGSRVTATAVDVVAVARERIEAWAPLCSENDIDLVLVSPSHGERAALADGHLEQILDNLIANALEVAPPRSSIEIAIGRVDSRELPHRILVRVLDRGPGMSPDQIAHAFDRFWQSDTRPTGSVGLGLPIVQQLVRANRGEIALRPREGGGLEVRLSFVAS
jgi:signal transduction histidine kinase